MEAAAMTQSINKRLAGGETQICLSCYIIISLLFRKELEFTSHSLIVSHCLWYNELELLFCLRGSYGNHFNLQVEYIISSLLIQILQNATPTLNSIDGIIPIVPSIPITVFQYIKQYLKVKII